MLTNMPNVIMRHWFSYLILSTSLLLVTTALARETQPYQGTIAVIINKQKTLKQLKLKPENLNPIFWRKQRYWPEGLPIKPVNLDAQHPMRNHFSQTILGSLPNAQIDYWNGQYFNGIRPPYSVKSEEAILRYVAKTKGAIGYVDACQVDERVKPVFWIVNHRVQKRRPELACK